MDRYIKQRIDRKQQTHASLIALSYNQSRVRSVLRSASFERARVALVLMGFMLSIGGGVVLNNYLDKPLIKPTDSRAATAVSPVSPAGFCPEPTIYNRAKQLWQDVVYTGQKAYAASPAGSDWGNAAGYYVPATLANIVEMAIGCGDAQLVSQIADVYNNAAGSLDQPITQSGVTRRRWTNAAQGEQLLSSGQWFYGLARVQSAIAATPAAQRTPVMITFETQYADAIAGYYKYYMFANQDGQNFSKPFAQIILDDIANYGDTTNTTYILSDQQTWQIAGFAQLYLAYKVDPSLVPLAANGYTITEAQMAKVLTDASMLVRQRSAAVTLTNYQGQPVTGYNFDPGYWYAIQGGQEYQYGETYTSPCMPIIPDLNDMPKVNALASVLSGGTITSCPVTGYANGWSLNYMSSYDFGHAWRLIPLFLSLYTIRPMLGASFPSNQDMTNLTNQILYGMSNKDPLYPILSNYWDGKRGWYRPQYHVGFGIAPGQLTGQFLDSGWGQLSGFNPDMRDLTRRFYAILVSSNPADIAYKNRVLESRDIQDYTVSRRAYENPNSMYWYYFLPTIPPADFAIGVPTPSGSPTSSPTPTIHPTITPTPSVTPMPSATPRPSTTPTLMPTTTPAALVRVTIPSTYPRIGSKAYDLAARSVSLTVSVTGTAPNLTATINGSATPITSGKLSLPNANGDYKVIIKDSTRTYFSQTIRIRHPDYNRDNTVNITDLNLLNSRIGKPYRAAYTIYDLNLDGKLDATDVAKLQAGWGR